MRHEKLFEPIAGPEPCGPDLDETGDDEYLNYILPAEERLPARFFDKDTGAPVDRSGIDLRAELKAISALLEKSRDLRLLALEARFQVLAGQITGFSESIQAMAGLVERYWNDVHPKPFDGDLTMRQNILGALDDRAKIILPLQYAPIIRDKRLGQITYRQYAVASGAATAREGETVPDKSVIVDALAHPDNRAAVGETYSALIAARDALGAIRTSFIEAAGYENAPNFDGLRGAIDDIAGLIRTSVPALAGEPAGTVVSPTGDAGAAPAEGPATTGVVASPAFAAPDLSTSIVKSHVDAAAALLAAEQYFATREASSPALILIHQARQLIGKPLVAAIEALSPETADQAAIDFEGALKFRIDMARMRALTEQLTNDAANAQPAEAPSREYSATSRPEAAALVAAVESYFRLAEPSSPVPHLLNKACSLTDRDFLTILKDLLSRQAEVT